MNTWPWCFDPRNYCATSKCIIAALFTLHLAASPLIRNRHIPEEIKPAIKPSSARFQECDHTAALSCCCQRMVLKFYFSTVRHSWTFHSTFLSAPWSTECIWINSSPRLTKITMEMNFSSYFVTNTQVGETILHWAHCDLVPVPSVAIHKCFIIPERTKLPLLLSLLWISFEWPTLMLVSQFSCSFYYLITCVCVCVCVPLQTPRWHIDLEPWASESHSLEDEAKRFLSYITTPQVSNHCLTSYWYFKWVPVV